MFAAMLYEISGCVFTKTRQNSNEYDTCPVFVHK